MADDVHQRLLRTLLKALTSYQKALQVLGNRKCNPDIWDTVMWELSTTLFSMATILQDFPSLGNKSSEEAEREVVEYLLKALKYCDLETPGSRQLIYQFRAATIHHRLASLYHRSFRNLPVEDSKRKNVLQLSRLHYEKASKLLLLLEHPSDFLRVQMERVALVEYQAQNATSNAVRIKHLQSAMELLCQCIPMLHVVKERLTVVDMNGKKKRQQKHPPEDSEVSLAQSVQNLCVDENKQKFGQRKDTVPGVSKSSAEEDCAEKEEIESLLRLLEQRLQFVLLQLAKLHHSRGGQAKKDADNSAQLYKNLYSIALRKNDSTVGCELAKHIFYVLSETENALRQTFSGTKTR